MPSTGPNPLEQTFDLFEFASQMRAQRHWKLAAEAVAQIESRGYARGRDLTGALVELRANGAY